MVIAIGHLDIAFSCGCMIVNAEEHSFPGKYRLSSKRVKSYVQSV